MHYKIRFLEALGEAFSALADSNLLQEVEDTNPWFNKASVLFALNHWRKLLTREKLTHWTTQYSWPDQQTQPKEVLVVMAGNLPLVGLHDLICVLLTGHRGLIKLSSRDNVLLPFALRQLAEQFPETLSKISFVDHLPDHPDAILASGSNETKRLFEQRFQGIPAIIRGNRNSIAVLSGEESRSQLEDLYRDIMVYHGMGCRSISLILAPDRDCITNLAAIHQSLPSPDLYKGYLNNVRQQKAIARLNKTRLIDTTDYILMESQQLKSPPGVVNYLLYSSETAVKDFIKKHTDQLQCYVSKQAYSEENPVAFGHAQLPEWTDYADQTDTLSFLLSLLR